MKIISDSEKRRVTVNNPQSKVIEIEVIDRLKDGDYCNTVYITKDELEEIKNYAENK